MAHLCKLNNALADEEKSRLHNAYNFTAPETLSQLEFTQTAAQVLHRPSFFPTPGWPMRLMMGEQADLLLEGQRVVPRRLLESGFVFAYPSLKEALESLV
jgi:NAD dependent epimerase/dehydratase family enzyme